MLVITREGKPQLERAVKIIRYEDGKHWWVNPHALIKRATGVHVGRHGCVVSFAAGLKAAGHRVWIDESRRGQLKRRYEFTDTNHCFYIYWLVGFAWGNDQWEKLIRDLQIQVTQDYWHEALEATAQHFYHRRYEKLRIVLPVAMWT